MGLSAGIPAPHENQSNALTLARQFYVADSEEVRTAELADRMTRFLMRDTSAVKHPKKKKGCLWRLSGLRPSTRQPKGKTALFFALR